MNEELQEALEHAAASPQLAGEPAVVAFLRELAAAAAEGREHPWPAGSERQAMRLRSRLHEYRESHPNRRYWIYLPRDSRRLTLRRPGESRSSPRPAARSWTLAWSALGLVALALGAYIAWRIQGAREPAPFAFGRDRNIVDFSVAASESHLVFTERNDATGQLRLFRLPLPDGEAVELANLRGPFRDLALSPSADRLAFWRDRAPGQFELIVYDFASQAELSLAQAPEASPLAWTPSGDALASTLGSGLHQWSLGSAPASPRVLSAPPAEAVDRSPAFRPQHPGQLLFHRHNPREGDAIFLRDAASGEARPLLSGLARYRGHAWAPGGSRFYFAAEYQGQRGLWVLPIGAQIPDLAGFGGTFSHSPQIPLPPASDPQAVPRLYWQDEAEHRDLARLDWPAKTWQPVEVPKPVLAAPIHSPDGKLWAAWVRDSPRASLWLAPRNYALALGDLEVRSSPAWSPDSRSLLFAARRLGRAQLYQQALEGGSPRLLASCAADIRAPHFSPDGRWVAFLCGYELFRMPWPATGEVPPVRVALGTWRALEVFPGLDGIVAVGFDASRSLVNLSTGAVSRLASGPPLADPASLASFRSGVFWANPFALLLKAPRWGDRFGDPIPAVVPATDTDRALSVTADGKTLYLLSRRIENLGLQGIRLAGR